MTPRFLLSSSLLGVALAMPVAAFAQHGGRIEVPEVPFDLTVPEGNVVYLQAQAYGTQNYICLPNGMGLAWKLFGPQATLYPPTVPLQVATHFLSPNPDEQGVARPTWQSSSDGSAVWGKAIQPSTDSNYVEPGAIPWLLVEKAGAAEGPLGGSQLSRTTYIHRVNTHGGAAPATGCTSSTHIDAFALVPYSTEYFLYRKARNE